MRLDRTLRRGQQRHKARDGISIEDLYATAGRSTGKRWLVRVRDPRVQAYIRRAFADRREAETWAKQERARVTLGASGAGSWPIDTVMADYLTAQRSAGRGAGLCRLIERVVAEVKTHGLATLEDPGLPGKVRTWLEHPTLSKTPRSDGKKIAARNTLRSRFMRLRGLCRHAHLHLHLPRDPLEGFAHPLLKVDGHAREAETFTIPELRAILGLAAYDNPAWRAMVVGMYAGGRRGDLELMRWSHLDLERRLWAIPVGKHGRRREAPIQAELAELLGRMTRAADAADSPVVDVPRLKIGLFRTLMDEAGITWDRGDDPVTGLPKRLTWHSTRHTAASLLSACGVDGVALQLALGHQSQDLTIHYAKARARHGRLIDAEQWPRGVVCLLHPPHPGTPATPAPDSTPAPVSTAT